ncbi:MAG: single-stranded-DNA-specific exonuclease RecJ [Leptolyngbyaceae bacterium]|nr:single-stranded-DNA-specific exonuclease RecJ [Leptolyngbyaceae bacterium]
MTVPEPIWQLPSNVTVDPEFMQVVGDYAPESDGHLAAQVLWSRGIRSVEQLAPFIHAEAYVPTPASAFGEEMDWAIARLVTAHASGELVAIWGDFDADGITATSVLWDGLGEFFTQGDRLSYFIPNRLTESHGLSMHGLDALAEQGVTLIVTCDTGSTNHAEIDYASQLGIDIIITDHHTLPAHRPDVTAIINPRTLPANHPLAHLSGVAVAYKLVEALYEAQPDVPTRPLTSLLDLVAIGLIADLVELTGDCRYLAQMGIRQLQTQVKHSTRPGIAALLKYCRRSGDRPTDISFGIGPRINAISRIHGDAHFCVDLLTSTDVEHCRQLAEATELANLRRKALQRDVEQQVTLKLAELDLSTTGVIVLADAQWSVGVLGLVAGQIAQTYGRPTILLNTSGSGAESGTGAFASNTTPSIARGSARSVNGINLYELVNSQSHLLLGFGGHPFAAGLSLRAEDVSLFADAINQEFRARYGTAIAQRPILKADLTVRVAELGRPLFRELALLEPYGMGNPIPRLLIRHCWFKKVWHRKIQDLSNRKLNYIKTTFDLWDDSVQQGFPGTWWGHYKEEVPEGRCDVIVELDYNSAPQGRDTPQYEVRLIAVRPVPVTASPYREVDSTVTWSAFKPSQPLLDRRIVQSAPEPSEMVEVRQRPATWRDFYEGIHQAQRQNAPLAIAFPPPTDQTPVEIWQTLVGIAKFLSRSQASVSIEELQHALSIGGRSLQLGLSALSAIGFSFSIAEDELTLAAELPPSPASSNDTPASLTHIQAFIAAVSEEQFRQRFFHEVPTSTLQAIADEFLHSNAPTDGLRTGH